MTSNGYTELNIYLGAFMNWRTFYLILALLFAIAALAPAQEEKEKKQKKGKLGEFVDDYGKKKKESDGKKKGDEEQDTSDDSSGGGWLGFILNIFFSPSEKDEESESEPAPKKPAPYPYHESNGLPIGSPAYRSYSILAEAGYLHLTDGLRGFQLAGDLRAHRFAANLDVHTVIEEIEKRNQSLTFFGLNAGYEVISTPYLLVRPYLGARNLNGLGIDFWGPEIGGRLLMMPQKPINIETNFAYSRINGKPLTILNGSVGVMINRFELRFGGQLFRSEWTSLEGVRVGVRVWL
jgi:hypothetical protein